MVFSLTAVTISRHVANAGGFYIVGTFFRERMSFPLEHHTLCNTASASVGWVGVGAVLLTNVLAELQLTEIMY